MMSDLRNRVPAAYGTGTLSGAGARERTANRKSVMTKSTTASDRRERLRTRLSGSAIAHIPAEEIAAHFDGMPSRYWQSVSESEVTLGLNTIHRYFEKLAEGDESGTSPVVAWRHFPARDFTKVMLCTWDRYGLLAKAAAAFSASGINIIRADVYTRADHVVLDVFDVCVGGKVIRDSGRLEQMLFLLDGALSEPPRFASLWACCRHKYLPQNNAPEATVSISNDMSPDCTVVRVEAADRLGLLYDIVMALADCGINITQAFIQTEGPLARDVFHITNVKGEKIWDDAQLELVDRKVRDAIRP
jgi:[protein-PII] uridylyltransferase